MKMVKIISLVVVSLVLLTGCTSGNTTDMVSQAQLDTVLAQVTTLADENTNLVERVQLLEDTRDVRTVANNLFVQTDQMDWDAMLNDVFTENVYFDMSSVGGSAGEVTAQSIVDGWEQGFASIESVHHQLGNMQIEVTGDWAKVFVYGTAVQYATTESGNNTRTFIGTYDIGLTRQDNGWRVNEFAFNLKMMDGNITFE